jgi:hypothetical protein
VTPTGQVKELDFGLAKAFAAPASSSAEGTGIAPARAAFRSPPTCSNESGRNEVYVQPYPGPGGKRQISTDGGTSPVWAGNGTELFYRNGDAMMTVGVATGSRFSVATPRLLFRGPYEEPARSPARRWIGGGTRGIKHPIAFVLVLLISGSIRSPRANPDPDCARGSKAGTCRGAGQPDVASQRSSKVSSSGPSGAP